MEKDRFIEIPNNLFYTKGTLQERFESFQKKLSNSKNLTVSKEDGGIVLQYHTNPDQLN